MIESNPSGRRAESLSTAWDALTRESASASRRSIQSLFQSDRDRAERFSLFAEDMLFDYSKTKIDIKILEQLLEIARLSGLDEYREAMFSGAAINITESRAALHTALRADSDSLTISDGYDVMPEIRSTLARMKKLSCEIREGVVKPLTAPKFTDVVNIGIGGSDLGPNMACNALRPYADGPKAHFISNIDGSHAHDTLSELNPRTTLIIVCSKTFTTIETLTNALTARSWMESSVGPESVRAQFAAVSSARDKTGGIRNRSGIRVHIWRLGRGKVFGLGADRIKPDDCDRTGKFSKVFTRWGDPWTAISDYPILLKTCRSCLH